MRAQEKKMAKTMGTRHETSHRQKDEPVNDNNKLHLDPSKDYYVATIKILVEVNKGEAPEEGFSAMLSDEARITTRSDEDWIIDWAYTKHPRPFKPDGIYEEGDLL